MMKFNYLKNFYFLFSLAILFSLLFIPLVNPIYLPNSTGSVGQKGFDNTNPPTTFLLDTQTGLSSSELNVISSDGADYLTQGAGSSLISGHKIGFYIEENRNNIFSLNVTMKGYGKSYIPPSTYNYAYYLYAWNGTSWGSALASHTSSSKNTLNGKITTNTINYINASDNLFYVLANSGLTGTAYNNAYLYYAQLELVPILTITSPLTTQGSTTTIFNISSAKELSWCGLSLDGSANITMTLNASSTGTNYTNSTMSDGGHTLVINCNDTSNVFSTVSSSFLTDLPTITFCKNLTIGDRVYTMQKDISTSSTSCLVIQANNITIEMSDKNITGIADASYGIYSSGYNQTTIKEGYIYDFVVGIYLINSNNNIIDWVFVNDCITGTNNGYGIYLYQNSSNNNLSNVIVENNENGIGIYNSNNNSVTATAYLNRIGILMVGGDNIVQGSNLSSSTLEDIRVISGEATVLDTIYDIALEGVYAGNLTRKWYYRAYVNDTNGNNVSSANVTAYNVLNDYQFNLTSGADGYTQQTEIIDYINNDGTRSYYSNYNIVASKSGYASQNHALNITATQNKLDDYFTLILITWRGGGRFVYNNPLLILKEAGYIYNKLNRTTGFVYDNEKNQLK